MDKIKKILLAIGLMVVLGGIVALGFYFLSKKEIIFKVPQISYKEPGNILSEPIIVGYTDKTLKKGEEFVIESGSLGSLFESQVGDIKLKLDDIRGNSIIVDILADKRSDQGFRPRDQILQTEIYDGSCILAYPLVTDSSYEYCFDLEKENGKLTLKYDLRGKSTMPTP